MTNRIAPPATSSPRRCVWYSDRLQACLDALPQGEQVRLYNEFREAAAHFIGDCQHLTQKVAIAPYGVAARYDIEVEPGPLPDAIRCYVVWFQKQQEWRVLYQFLAEIYWEDRAHKPDSN